MIKKILLPLVLLVIFAIAVLAQPAMQETETAEEIAQEVAKEETAELAAYSGTCGTNLKWTLDNGTLTISGTGNMTSWSSSSSAPWYSYRSSIKSVIIGDSVTSIGDDAFYDCDSLTSVTIGDSVTSIGERAFAYCDSLTSVTIGDSVTSIGEYTFYNCSSLTSVTFGENSMLLSIGNEAFFFCDSLTSINIPLEVTSIGDRAFYFCKRLASITIPDSVTSIGNGAFEYCTSLTSAIIYSKTVTFAYNNVFFNSKPDIIIYGYEDSTAETYANENGITFQIISELDFDNSGELDKEDVKTVAQDMLKSISNLTEKQKAAANLYTADDGENGEPIINIKDLIKLAQIIAENK